MMTEKMQATKKRTNAELYETYHSMEATFHTLNEERNL